MKIHELKCWPESFQAIDEGRKRFEVRVNDREFKVDDLLHLKEYEPNSLYERKGGSYTGFDLVAGVTHIFGPEDKPEGFLAKGVVVMSIYILVTSERQNGA